MNGETKLKIKGGFVGGFIGAIVVLVVWFGNLSYSYGEFSSRLDEVEKKADKIYEIDTRLTRIEVIVNRIDKKLQ